MEGRRKLSVLYIHHEPYVHHTYGQLQNFINTIDRFELKFLEDDFLTVSLVML